MCYKIHHSFTYQLSFSHRIVFTSLHIDETRTEKGRWQEERSNFLLKSMCLVTDFYLQKHSWALDNFLICFEIPLRRCKMCHTIYIVIYFVVYLLHIPFCSDKMWERNSIFPVLNDIMNNKNMRSSAYNVLRERKQNFPLHWIIDIVSKFKNSLSYCSLFETQPRRVNDTPRRRKWWSGNAFVGSHFREKQFKRAPDAKLMKDLSTTCWEEFIAPIELRVL